MSHLHIMCITPPSPRCEHALGGSLQDLPRKRLLISNCMHSLRHSTPPLSSLHPFPFAGRPAWLQIHWLSIINSFVLVLILTVFLGIILLRILKNDFTKYMDGDDVRRG